MLFFKECALGVDIRTVVCGVVGKKCLEGII